LELNAALNSKFNWGKNWIYLLIKFTKWITYNGYILCQWNSKYNEV